MGEWIPAGADLEKFALLSEDNGLFVKNLPVSTLIQLESIDGAILQLTVLDSLTGRARLNIKNSLNVDGDHEGIVSGSTFGGSMIKVGWIGTGMCLEFNVFEEKRLVMRAWIKSISVVMFTPKGEQAN